MLRIVGWEAGTGGLEFWRGGLVMGCARSGRSRCLRPSIVDHGLWKRRICAVRVDTLARNPSDDLKVEVCPGFCLKSKIHSSSFRAETRNSQTSNIIRTKVISISFKHLL